MRHWGGAKFGVAEFSALLAVPTAARLPHGKLRRRP